MASEEDGVNTENYVVPELPQPNTSNLNQVLEIVEEAAKQPTHRDGLAFALMDKVGGRVGVSASVQRLVLTEVPPVWGVQNAGYLCSLLEVFGDLEDFDMVPELQTLFQIMRTIRESRACATSAVCVRMRAHSWTCLRVRVPPVCLNSLDIFQVVLSDELFAAFAGVMECANAPTYPLARTVQA